MKETANNLLRANLILLANEISFFYNLSRIPTT